MAKAELFMKAFAAFERAGLHVTPRHYYHPVPDLAWLRKNPRLWIGRSSLTGIKWDLAAQLAWLEGICRPYYGEVAGLAFYNTLPQNRYAPIDSQVLHCFIRSSAPRRIIEIGSGASTLCMLEAARRNARDGKPFPEITCIEPYPGNALRDSKEIHLIRQQCQEVPASVFSELSAGDLLFIDSSHSLKVGSDVTRIYLEIIPALGPGVYLHIHDIYLPYTYPRSVFTRPYWWQETALLTALLVNNSRLNVLACLSALHYDHPDQMQNMLTDYRPAPNNNGLLVPGGKGHFPDAMWLQTV